RLGAEHDVADIVVTFDEVAGVVESGPSVEGGAVNLVAIVVVNEPAHTHAIDVGTSAANGTLWDGRSVGPELEARLVEDQGFVWLYQASNVFNDIEARIGADVGSSECCVRVVALNFVQLLRLLQLSSHGLTDQRGAIAERHAQLVHVTASVNECVEPGVLADLRVSENLSASHVCSNSNFIRGVQDLFTRTLIDFIGDSAGLRVEQDAEAALEVELSLLIGQFDRR